MRIFTELSQKRKEMERLSGRLEGMVCCGKQVQRLAELSANSD